MHRRTWSDLFSKANIASLLTVLTIPTMSFLAPVAIAQDQSQEQGVFGKLELAPPPSSQQDDPDWNSFSPLPVTRQSNSGSNSGSNVWQSEPLNPVSGLPKPVPDLNTIQSPSTATPESLGPIEGDPFLPRVDSLGSRSLNQSWQPPTPIQSAPAAATPQAQATPDHLQGEQSHGQVTLGQQQAPNIYSAPDSVQDHLGHDLSVQDYSAQDFSISEYPAPVYTPTVNQAASGSAASLSEVAANSHRSRFNLGGKLKSLFARKSSRQPYFDPTPLRIRLQAEALYLSHSGGDDEPFILDPTTFATLFRHSDIGPGSEVGGRFRLLFQSEGGSGYELAYTRVDEFRDEVSFENGIPLFFGGMPASSDPPYTSSYASKFKNYEFNAFVRKNSWLRIGGGLRIMDLRENFDTEGGSGGFFSDTDNDLFGGQLTVDLYRRISRFANLELGGRFGIYHNNVDVRFFSATRSLHYEDEVFSSNIDLNAGLAVQLTLSTMFRFGYQRMMIYDAALAPNQSTGFGFTDTSAPANLSDLKLDGFYCGVTTRF